jgi:hypothetical protein
MHKGRQYPRHLSGFYLANLPWNQWPPLRLTMQIGAGWPIITGTPSWTAVEATFDPTTGLFSYTRTHTDNGLNISISMGIYPTLTAPGNTMNLGITAFGTPIPVHYISWPDGDSPFDYVPIDWAFTLLPPFSGIAHLEARCVRYY